MNGFGSNSFSHRLYVLLPVVLICLLEAGCTKEDDYRRQKEELTFTLTEEIRADSLRSYVTWMQDMGTRFALAENRRYVAAMIRNRFNEFGYHETRLDSFLMKRTWQDVEYNLWQYNVIATLRGTEHPDSICVVGAHYDDILGAGNPFTAAPGANDNASGVAAALEIARVLKKHAFAPDCTIEFVAFAAEELGLYGSWDYAHKADSLGWKIKMMINNDMIAYETAEVASDWHINIMHYDNSIELCDKAYELCDKFTILKSMTDNGVNTRSDSYPFAANGFPAIFFHVYDSDPYYHTLDDRVENCSFYYCREVVNISLALLIELN